MGTSLFRGNRRRKFLHCLAVGRGAGAIVAGAYPSVPAVYDRADGAVKEAVDVR
jgi:hypothetical protein